MTFRQAKELGVSIRGGEKATHIVFFKPVTKKATDEDDEQQDEFFLMRSCCVFNVEQTTGLDHLPVGNAPLPVHEVEERYEYADAVIVATGFTIRHGGCFLAGELGLPTGEGLPNHASYLPHWIQLMQADSRAIFRASAQASRAVDHILSFSRTAEAVPKSTKPSSPDALHTGQRDRSTACPSFDLADTA